MFCSFFSWASAVQVYIGVHEILQVNTRQQQKRGGCRARIFDRIYPNLPEFARIPPEFRLDFARIVTLEKMGGGGGGVPPAPVSYAYVVN